MMKISKLLKVGAFALLAASLCFTSCKTEDDDDTKNAISGSNTNYKVEYTNSESDIYRCWNTTTFKHEGELVKITFNNQTVSTHNGVMGFVWDLGQSKDAASVTEGSTTTAPAVTAKGYQNFMVIGFRNQSSGLQYYVSKFFNVTNLQADNFGATSANKVTTHKEGIVKTVPCEIDVTKGWKSAGISTIASDKTMTAWIDIYPLFTNSKYGVKHNSDANKYTGSDVGAYVVDIYDTDPTATGFSGTPVATTTIEPSVTGYSAEPTQKTLAVYANVQPSKTLSGAWYLANDYAADEVVEE